MTDRNYRRHVGKHQKTWNSDAQQAEAKDRQRREARTISITGSSSPSSSSSGKVKKGAGQKASSKPGGSGSSSGKKSSGSRKRSSSSSGSRSPVRLGPKQNYTAPFMNVVQPLEALAEAASAASTARARGAVGVGAGDDRPLAPIPVMLGVNADEGLMFVHGAFPVTMPRVRVG